MNASTDENIKLKSYTLKELAAIYEMKPRTFKKYHIDPIADLLGKKNGRFFTIEQVECIFKSNKLPRTLKREKMES